MKIIKVKTKDLIPYENNPRINEEAVKPVAESIKQFGFKVPIVIDSDNVIVAGHTRLKASKLLELKEVPCIVADDLTEKQIKAFRLADNKVGEIAVWDFALLEQELGELDDMGDFGLEEDDSGLVGRSNEEEEIYTKKVDAPIYEPKKDKPNLDELIKEEKTNNFLSEIEKLEINAKEKDFLRKAASRHLVFDYSKIADYYANSNKQVQDIMEKLALVIIDFDKAIEYGYVKLSKEVDEQYGKDYE